MNGVRCTLMRGGTSKGAYFLAADLPANPAERDDCDVDYLFLQLGVEDPTVSDRQTCGNLLAGVGQSPLGDRRAGVG